MSTLNEEMAYFSKQIAKLGSLGIGDYLKLALPYGIFTREDPTFWWCNSVTGSDTANTGQTPNSPFKTIQKAIDSAGTATDGQGDIIFLQSGNGTDYTGDTVGVSLSNAYVYINKPDLSIIGVGPRNSIRICPGAAATAGVIALGANADRVTLANFTIDTTTAQSAAIVTASGCHNPTISDIDFWLVGASGPTGVGIDFDAAAVNYPVIKNCNFYCGTLLIAGIRMKCGVTGGKIENCFFVNTEVAGTPTVDAINVKAGKFIHISNTTISGGLASSHLFGDGIDIDSGVINATINHCFIGGCTAAVTDGGTSSIGVVAGFTAIANA